MLTNAGNAGSQMPVKVYRIEYACPCGNRTQVDIKIMRNTSGINIPDLRCPKCPGLPLMAQAPPRPVDASKIIRPLLAASPLVKPS